MAKDKGILFLDYSVCPTESKPVLERASGLYNLLHYWMLARDLFTFNYIWADDYQQALAVVERMGRPFYQICKDDMKDVCMRRSR